MTDVLKAMMEPGATTTLGGGSGGWVAYPLFMFKKAVRISHALGESLERSGYVKYSSHGLYYITKAGKEAARD